MGKKRGRLDIIEDMLRAVQKKRGTIKPTHLMYKSNLSYKQMNAYLEELYNKGFLSKETTKDGKDKIILEERGFEFLAKLQEMKEFEKTFGL